jgi:hypothetical protein
VLVEGLLVVVVVVVAVMALSDLFVIVGAPVVDFVVQLWQRPDQRH